MQACERERWIGNRNDNLVFCSNFVVLYHLAQQLKTCMETLCVAIPPVCATLTHEHIHIPCHSPPFQEKKLFSIVHFTTGNVGVRCSVDHSDIYGSRCTFKCKLIFTVGSTRHNDTYLQNPKGSLNKSKRNFLTKYSIWMGFYLNKNLTLLNLKT